MNSGIYKITCTANARYYIGRTCNYKKRVKDHLKALKSNTHKNVRLQNCYNKYGEEALTFSLIEPIDKNNKELQIEREQSYIDRYISSSLCLNINRTAKTFCDVPMTQERKDKISAANKGKKRKCKTLEQKKHMSQIMLGHILSEETKEKIRQARTGQKLSESTLKKLSVAFSGENNPMYGRTGSKHPFSIPIWQIDCLTKKKIRKFESAVEAAKAFGVKDGSNLRKAIKKGIKAYGYLWVEDKSLSTIESTAQAVNE